MKSDPVCVTLMYCDFLTIFFVSRLVKKGFFFKNNECNKVMHKIFLHELLPQDRLETSRFLLENGGSVNLRYEGGDS